jgi:hypothetical protein
MEVSQLSKVPILIPNVKRRLVFCDDARRFCEIKKKAIFICPAGKTINIARYGDTRNVKNNENYFGLCAKFESIFVIHPLCRNSFIRPLMRAKRRLSNEV